MNDVELIAIMPVFNEEAGIARVITGWLEALSRERITYLLVAINDGSTDAWQSSISFDYDFPHSLLS